MKYSHEYNQGRVATDAAKCPYAASQLGKRCAWMGGFYDSRAGFEIQKRHRSMDRAVG
jgi:ribosome modulation factor